MDFLSCSLSVDVDGHLKVLVWSRFSYIDLDFIVDKKISTINLRSLSWTSKAAWSELWERAALLTCSDPI